MKFFKQLRCWSIINRFVAYVVIYLACLVPYFPDTYCLHVYGAVDLRILGLLYCVGLNHNKNLFICEVLGDIVAHCMARRRITTSLDWCVNAVTSILANCVDFDPEHCIVSTELYNYRDVCQRGTDKHEPSF